MGRIGRMGIMAGAITDGSRCYPHWATRSPHRGGRKDGGGGGWADFADGFGFWISHMVLRVLSVE
jgi:hypothetical protein